MEIAIAEGAVIWLSHDVQRPCRLSALAASLGPREETGARSSSCLQPPHPMDCNLNMSQAGSISPVRPRRGYDRVKRIMDVVISLGALIGLSPVLLTIALLVRSRLGSPVLFRQVRPGLGARPFEMIKFRTMLDAVGSDGQPLSDAERLTPFGRWLRSTSLDELPELWNVLKGDMSLVGPRPLLTAYLPYYREDETLRHSVRPGITGIAQLNGRNGARWDDRIADDVWYVRHRSARVDLNVIVATVGKVIRRDGVATDPRSQQLDLHVERAAAFPVQNLLETDAKAVADLFQTALMAPSRAATMIGSPRLPALLAEVLMRRDEFLGVKHGGDLIGAIHLTRAAGSLHVNYLAVREAYRGAHLGERLIEDGLRRAASGMMTLDVEENNAPAMRLYARLGFADAAIERRLIVQGANPDPAFWRRDEFIQSLTDPIFFKRFGIGQLRMGRGGEAVLTVVEPGHLRLPADVDESILAATELLPYSSISVPARFSERYADRITLSFTSKRMSVRGTDR